MFYAEAEIASRLKSLSVQVKYFQNFCSVLVMAFDNADTADAKLCPWAPYLRIKTFPRRQRERVFSHEVVASISHGAQVRGHCRPDLAIREAMTSIISTIDRAMSRP